MRAILAMILLAISSQVATEQALRPLFDFSGPEAARKLKEDADIPRIETLQLIPEPDGSATDDFVVPERLQERQNRQHGGGGRTE